MGGPPPVAEKGVYVFRFEVGDAHPEYYHDEDSDKSELLQIGEHEVKYAGYDEGTGLETIRASYVLVDSGNPIVDAAQAQIRVYDPDLLLAAGPVTGPRLTSPPGAQDPTWNEVAYEVNVDKEGTWYHVFAAQEDRAASDKGHRQRWALQANQRQNRLRAVCYDFANYPPGGPAGTTPLAAETLATLRPAHYTGQVYTNQTVQHATQQITIGQQPQHGPASIFFVFGHGGYTAVAGALQEQWPIQTFWTGVAPWYYLVDKTRMKNRLTGAGVAAGRVVSIEADIENGSLAHVQLATMVGCKTARTSPRYGNPALGLRTKGAQCTLGFTRTIYSDDGPQKPGAEYWVRRFWRLMVDGEQVPQNGVLVNKRYSVKTAAKKAAGECFHRFALHSVKVYGNGGFQLPAPVAN